MRGRKAAAKFVRQARALMNDKGKHWTRGEWKKKIRGRKGEDVADFKFCFLGGVQQVIFGDTVQNDPKRFSRLAYVAAITEAAKQIDPHRYEWVQERYAGHTAPHVRHMYLNELESIVMRWNDRPIRTWTEVEARLMEVADALEGIEG